MMRYFLNLSDREPAEIEVKQDLYESAQKTTESPEHIEEPIAVLHVLGYGDSKGFRYAAELDRPRPPLRDTINASWAKHDPEVLLPAAFLNELSYSGAGLA